MTFDGGGGASPLRRMLSGESALLPVPLIRTGLPEVGRVSGGRCSLAILPRIPVPLIRTGLPEVERVLGGRCSARISPVSVISRQITGNSWVNKTGRRIQRLNHATTQRLTRDLLSWIDLDQGKTGNCW